MTTSPEGIKNRFSQFFQGVYSSRVQYSPSDLQKFLGDISFLVLEEDSKKRMEEDITLEEVQAAIAGLQKGKTQGVDGLPMEFYSQHVDMLAPRLTILLSDFVKQGVLPDSKAEAVIVLVPKSGRDP